MKRLFIFILIISFLLSGCGRSKASPEVPKNSEAPNKIENAPENNKENEKIPFLFGDGIKEVSVGEEISGWVLESFESSGDETKAVFSGSISAEGYLYLCPMASEEPVYLFEIDEKYLPDFPVFSEDTRSSVILQIDPESKIYSKIPDITGYKNHCNFVISEYTYIFAPMSVYSFAKVDSADFWAEIEMNEPEIIADHIAALNEITLETFGFEPKSFNNNLIPLYKEPLSGITFDKTPDLIVTVPELEQYPEYYQNQSLEELYEFSNFKNEQEIVDYLSQWVAPEFFDTENFRKHIFEFDGKAYLARYSRGYGVKSYGNAEIIFESENEMTAKIFIYDVKSVESGTAEIKFEKKDGNWVIVSVTDSYYRN